MSYKRIKRDGKFLREHRIIMEEHLGRKLLPDEVVHHKDGNKKNNAIENLEVMKNLDHSKMHNPPQTTTNKEQDKPKNYESIDLKLRIIDSLPGRTARQVASLLGISETTLSYHLTILRKIDVIRKVGYGTWEVVHANKQRIYSPFHRVKKESKQLRISKPSRLPQAIELRNNTETDQDMIVSHAFLFTLQLPSLAKWNKEGRRKYLAAKGIEHTPVNQGERLEVNGWKVHLTNLSLVGYAPKGERWVARTAQEGFQAAVFDFLIVIQKIESMLGVSLRSQGQYKLKVRREHHGFIRNALAKQYVREGKRLAVHDELGRWLLIDLSLTEGELETHAGGTEERVKDIRDANKKVQDFFNGVKATGGTPQMILENDARIQEKLLAYAEHIETHVKVMQQIGKFLEEIERRKL